MSDEKGLPKWPESLPIPDRIEETVMHELEAEDVESEDDIHELVRLMFAHNERGFHLFLEQGKPLNKAIKERLERFGILLGDSEFYYYKHPKLERNYIRIQRHRIQFDWEQDVVDKGPMFFRTSLKLSQAMTRQLTIQEQLTIEKTQDVNPLELKPNVFGIGLDLSKFFRWASRWFKRNRE